MELTGTVRNVIDFGVSWTSASIRTVWCIFPGLRPASAPPPQRGVVKVGDVVKVVVLNVDEKRHRISLSPEQAK